ncbi:serine-rich adhesin for platelets isoform X2 [Eupeodes corollae]|uniref:serine-rich adhesin for platelets isoform X2 n=1 Tax=Eupeodes corollae TaxID=290404 RepID=UPI0024927712|nr:serine-rich adhesin for platelets isoform X2 [Eupeodes corollae]
MAKISRRSVASNSSPADSNANSISSPTNDNSGNINNINKQSTNSNTNSKPKSLSTNFSSSPSIVSHVNSDIPLSSSSSSSLSKTTIQTQTDSSSAIAPPQHDTSFPDPLRSNGSQFTTRTILNGHHNNNNHGYSSSSSSSANHQVSSQSSSKSADKTNTYNRISTTPLPSSTTTLLAGHPSITIPYSNLSDHNITQAQILAAERERIRAEFFATYDVMTGVRIAATLGGFFSLMVFLIVWKSRSHTDETLRVLKDPKIAAVAAACMQEEEERKIQEAMEATGMSIYPDEYDAILYRRQRMLSLGNVSAPPVLHRGYRFSSVGGGGYSSLLEPPRRYSYSYGGGRRKSGSESSRVLTNYPMGSSFGTDDYFMETDDELENPEFEVSHRRTDSVKGHGFLEAAESRRSSAMTCCSTESSYLERRCSALTLGLGNLPPSLRRKLSTASRTSSNDMWDYYYPDIQVIQPTPSASPCPSERIFNDQATSSSHPTKEASAASITKTAISSSTTAAIIQQKQITTAPSTTTTTTAAANPTAGAAAPHFVRKHSIAYYDPESAQSGRQQHIHSISADTADFLPYPISAKVVQLHEKYDDSSELKLVVRRKISAPLEGTTNGRIIDNNNSYTYPNEFSTTTGNGGNNSIGSLGSAADLSKNATTNAGPKRAPLASLSSFKISSIEYQDSEIRSLDEDSVFLDSIADTDEDMEQFSTDSDEISLEDDGIEDGPTKVPTSITVASPISNLSHNHEDIHSVKSVPPMSHFSDTRRTLGSNVSSSFKRPRRPILERHKSISIATSNEKISLIGGHQMKDFSQQQSFDSTNRGQPLETHFTILPRQDTTESTPSSQRRLLVKPQLQQQISAEQTTEETTTNTTTTTAETCSTFNTEIPQGQQFYGGPDEIISPSQHSILPLISMPASLKNLIRQNSPPACSSVILELPLIKLPTTDESSDNSYVDNNDDDDKSRSKSDESRDPSLPGSSRKWSRETLF